jgi:hypothetical protein
MQGSRRALGCERVEILDLITSYGVRDARAKEEEPNDEDEAADEYDETNEPGALLLPAALDHGFRLRLAARFETFAAFLLRLGRLLGRRGGYRSASGTARSTPRLPLLLLWRHDGEANLSGRE